MKTITAPLVIIGPGTSRRFVVDTADVRHIRFDARSNSALNQIIATLSQPNDASETLSTSIAVRRAVNYYNQALQRLSPGERFNESIAIRERTKKPGPKRKPKMVFRTHTTA